MYEHQPGDDLAKMLVKDLGAVTVKGSVCSWLGSNSKRLGTVQAMWTTNASHIAKALSPSPSKQKQLLRRHARQIDVATVTECDSCPPELTRAVLTGLRDQAFEDGILCELESRFGGPVPNHPVIDWHDPNL